MIFIENRQRKIDLNLKQLKNNFHKIANLLACENKEINLIFVDDKEIREINKDYLQRDSSTNVISFSMTEGEFGNINPEILGDIVISVETAHRDAKKDKISLEDELDFLIVHGLLHLLGYEHENTNLQKTQIMKKKEQEVFLLLKGYFFE